MVKRGSALAVVVSVAVAALRIATPAAPANSAVGGPAKRLSSTLPLLTAHPPAGDPLIGGCSAYLEEKKPEKKSPYPNDENKYAATKVIDRFFGGHPAPDHSVRYAIALAPDPAHTNLSLMFDREIALIQQAAEDQGYLYDSSWMPWKSDPPQPPGDLAGHQNAADLLDAREACPGVLLFRKQADALQPASDWFGSGLVVLVVGEQATGGINANQWANAVKWLSDKKAADSMLRILGPTFSGSLVSLERNLHDIYASDPERKVASDSTRRLFAENFNGARILSGSVSGCSSVQWFQQKLRDSDPSRKLQFGSFQENDSVHIFRLLEYLRKQGTQPKDVAVLSEDETAYAALPPATKAIPKTEEKDDPCNFEYDVNNRPVNLVYPRDISALRNAYEKESVFDSSAGISKERSIHPILRDVGGTGTGNGEVTDTVPTYSGAVAAIAQEAYLYGVVSFLRTHHTRYLVLRSTNPLDYLFLTRFFHRAYPQARIVTVGSDILFRREIDTTEFRGVLSLTSYPLLPTDQHWSRITDAEWDRQPHDHLVFEGHLPEGQYIAASYLFQDVTDKPGGPTFLSPDWNPAGPLIVNRVIPTPDYADPFWFAESAEKPLASPARPPTWLIAVGRDGYWPVAVLNNPQDENFLDKPEKYVRKSEEKMADGPHSTMVSLTPVANAQQHYEYEPGSNPPAFNHKLLITLPLPWVGCAIVAFLLGCYQTFGLFKGKTRYSDHLVAVFQATGDPSQKLIQGVSSALAIMPLCALMQATLVPGDVFAVTNSGPSIRAWWVCILLLSAVLLFVYLRTSVSNGIILYGISPAYSIAFVLPLTLFCIAIWFGFHDRFDRSDLIPRFYRMIHITDGVSPLFPVLLLTFGFYLWAWQALAGNLILAKGCPTLPEVQQDANAPEDSGLKRGYKRFLGRSHEIPQNVSYFLDLADERISQNLGRRILQIASPFGFSWRIALAPPVILIAARLLFGPSNLPLLSLEGNNFNTLLNLLLLTALIVTMMEALRLYSTWTALRKLLHALARLRLRRTIARLRRIEANSLWSVSGNVRRFQYGIFVQQIEAANRLAKLGGTSFPSLTRLKAYSEQFTALAESEHGGAPWSEDIQPSDAAYPPKPMRQALSEAVAEVYCWLDERWAEETTSLSLDLADKESDDPSTDPRVIPLSDDKRVQAAEEFVAFHYIAFIQNIVARIRTITLSMALLFVSVCLAISFYPFVPRTEISIWMIVNLALIGLTVAYVYAGMDRDEILSYIANTRPGRLGPEFYVKLAGFLAAPTIGILTTQFPAIADTAMQWLQPGLDAIK